MIIVKSSLDGDVRRFAYAFDRASTFQQFKETIARLYSLDRSVDFLVKYHDEEGDAITISTNEELLEALTLASGEEEAVLRITVLLTKSKAASSNATTATIPAPAPVAPEPERTPPPLKYLSAPKPAFTQTPASQQMLDKASTFFSTLLWDRLFTQPEFQDKFRAVVREAMSTPAFADLLQSIAADMHPAAAASPAPTMTASTSTLATETSTAATSTEEEIAEAEEIAEFEKLKEPATPAPVPTPAPAPTPAVVPEPKKEEPVPALPTAPTPPTSPPIDIPNQRRKSEDPAIRRSPSSGVFGFISSLPSALSNLVSPHAADPTNPTPAGKRAKEELADNNTEYDGLLAQLVDMGFNDRDANLHALKRTKGNLERAVERLLRKAPKGASK